MPIDHGARGGSLTAYTAGGLFTQSELLGNVQFKEAVWRLSGGRYELVLPQSREPRQLKRADIKEYIRNTDLLSVLEADLLLANFDGLDLDSGTVVEFVFAKMLGKPAVLLRTDFRRQYASGLSEPYNLMVRNWPRSLEIMLDLYLDNANQLAEIRRETTDDETPSDLLEAELRAVHLAVEQTAGKVITGFETVLEMENPYPPELRESAYRMARLSLGSGFGELLGEDALEEIMAGLKERGTL